MKMQQVPTFLSIKSGQEKERGLHTMMHTFTLSRGKQKQMDLWNLRRQKKDLRNWGGGNARNGTQGLSHARQALNHSATFQLLFFYNLFREGSQYAEIPWAKGPTWLHYRPEPPSLSPFFFPKGEKKTEEKKMSHQQAMTRKAPNSVSSLQTF